MSVLKINFRLLVVIALMVLVHNTDAGKSRISSKTLLIGAGSVLVNEKNASELFGEEYISARKQAIAGKVIVGSLANTYDYSLAVYKNSLQTSDRVVRETSTSARVGYVIVNGSLRLAADQYSLDEEYINQKCDEYLPENIAWIAKPFANIAVDLAYDYVTVKLVKGIVSGSNKSRDL